MVNRHNAFYKCADVEPNYFTTLFYSNFILKKNGDILACGNNIEGTLGLGDIVNRSVYSKIEVIPKNIRFIYSSNDHTPHSSIIVANDGAYVAGKNRYSYGNLGLGLGDDVIVNTFTKIESVPKNIKKIAMGGVCTYILTTTGELYVCGNNYNGNLGLGDTVNRNIYVKVTNCPNNIVDVFTYSGGVFILTDNLELYGCGYNNGGMLGLGDNISRSIFTKLPWFTSDYKKITIDGYGSLLFLKNNGELWALGNNDFGQLGVGEYGTGRNVLTKISGLNGCPSDIKDCFSGYRNSFILTYSGELWGAGENWSGPLGLGDTSYRTVFTKVNGIPDNIKQLEFTVYDNAIFLTEDNKLYGSGSGGFGTVGFGTTENKLFFTEIINRPNNIKKIYTGYYTSYLLTEADELYATGYNNFGELGLGHTDKVFSYTKINAYP